MKTEVEAALAAARALRLQHAFSNLNQHEQECILEALRIALRHEQAAERNEPQWKFYHGHQARKFISLLEALNPKAPTVPGGLPSEQRSVPPAPITELDI